MTLIVEDGSGTDPSANSYVDSQAIIDFAALRGLTITPTEAVPAGIAAMDYLATIDDTLQGTPTSSTQPLPYPKTGIIVGCEGTEEFPDDEIPNAIVNAQLWLAFYAFQGVEFNAPIESGTIKREKTDVLETEYMTPVDGGSVVTVPKMPTVNAALRPVTIGCGVVSGFTTVRV